MRVLIHGYNNYYLSTTTGRNATWTFREGLLDSDWISIEAYNQAGFVVGQQFGVMALVEVNDSMTDRMREDATFIIEE